MRNHPFISGGAALALSFAVLIGDGCSKSSSTGPAPGGVGSVITVAGRVMNRNGGAVAGVPVVVTGQPSTNTDANGNFSIPNVTTPYDIAVVDGTTKNAFVYKGLTRTDPTLVSLFAPTSNTHTGNISGKISGGDFTPSQGANDVTQIVFGSPETSSSTVSAAGGTFGPLSVGWSGPTVTTGSLYALQMQNDPAAPNLPLTYKGYGVKTGIAVNDGSTLTNLFDTLQAVGTSQFTANVSLPAGYSFTSKVLSTRVSSMAVIPLISENTATTALTYNTPSIAGATLVLGINAGNAGAIAISFKMGLSPGAAGIAITIPPAPALSLPINGATKVDTTFTFSWTAYVGGIHVFFMQSAGNPTYFVLTAGTSTTIPNLKSLGLPLPATATYTWRVAGFAPFASTDAAAGPGGFYTISSSPVSLTADANAGESAPWTFTTAP